MNKNIKYPDAIISDLSKVFASKDANAATYLSGSKLTYLFPVFRNGTPGSNLDQSDQ